MGWVGGMGYLICLVCIYVYSGGARTDFPLAGPIKARVSPSGANCGFESPKRKTTGGGKPAQVSVSFPTGTRFMPPGWVGEGWGR